MRAGVALLADAHADMSVGVLATGAVHAIRVASHAALSGPSSANQSHPAHRSNSLGDGSQRGQMCSPQSPQIQGASQWVWCRSS